MRTVRGPVPAGASEAVISERRLPPRRKVHLTTLGSLFFFKQKTAYEIQVDWSSDVCSSDLAVLDGFPRTTSSSCTVRGKPSNTASVSKVTGLRNKILVPILSTAISPREVFVLAMSSASLRTHSIIGTQP